MMNNTTIAVVTLYDDTSVGVVLVKTKNSLRVTVIETDKNGDKKITVIERV